MSTEFVIGAFVGLVFGLIIYWIGYERGRKFQLEKEIARNRALAEAWEKRP